MVAKRLVSGVAVLLLATVATGALASAPDLKAAPQAGLQALPGWQQVNANGFGDLDAVQIAALEVFGGYLYAGTENPTDGARIFRSQDGTTWTPVTEPGFNIMHDHRPPAIIALEVYNGRLYAGTGWGDQRGQVWRTQDGMIWTPMEIAGFGDQDTKHVAALVGYNGMLYAGAGNLITGAQVWRSYSGENNTWNQVAPALPGTGPASISGFAVYDGALYAVVESEEAPVQVWRTYSTDWETMVSDGFGNSQTVWTGGMAVFGTYLYVGAGNQQTGAQLWRTNDGVNWEQMITPGFGDPQNQKIESVFVFLNQLFVSVKNMQTGIEVWRSADGTNWEQVNTDGFDDSHNTGSNRSNATAEFLGQLYVGTSNALDGGEVWRMVQTTQAHATYLPLILR
jgi:hypothetical protein